MVVRAMTASVHVHLAEQLHNVQVRPVHVQLQALMPNRPSRQT